MPAAGHVEDGANLHDFMSARAAFYRYMTTVFVMDIRLSCRKLATTDVAWPMIPCAFCKCVTSIVRVQRD